MEENGRSSEKLPLVLKETEKQLLKYFKGSRQIFNLKIAPAGTDFQHKVWEYVNAVPFGETTSYLDIALNWKQWKAHRIC